MSEQTIQCEVCNGTICAFCVFNNMSNGSNITQVETHENG